ncbi:DNA polymerase III subunit gamma/tau [Zhongshania guokunii]|uniref:DNA polymerase III subunit gamma/tau n=1 Tax=Zhongshania guokunii TaxID=641783 RepID=A0ABV3U353_9GAMM
MSYQVLARKWRPKTFREMAGQNHVLKALINALDHDRLHHAYLFTGTRGVGKTTIARILAKCLNCEAGVSSEPCGQCNACVAINEGRFVDLLEVDAASRTKVEDTREILDNVQYTPSQGRYKVYLIDEVHMLSSSSFNALLKTLEEPPAHVKFLLATTDPQKLPATILSRCLQFNLKNLTAERIVEYLKTILEKEMVQYEEPSLWLLGRAADGSMRDALSLTDQAIAFGSGSLGEADVRQMLGTIDHGSVYRLISALSASDGAALLSIVADLAEMGADFAGVVSELLVVLHRLAVAQTVAEGLDNSLGDRQRIIDLAASLSAEDVQFYYQMGLAGRRDMGLAPDPRAGLEMLLLRMLAFKPQGVIDAPKQALPRAKPAVGAVDTEKKSLANEPTAAVKGSAVVNPVSAEPDPVRQEAAVRNSAAQPQVAPSTAISDSAPPQSRALPKPPVQTMPQAEVSAPATSSSVPPWEEQAVLNHKPVNPILEAPVAENRPTTLIAEPKPTQAVSPAPANTPVNAVAVAPAAPNAALNTTDATVAAPLQGKISLAEFSERHWREHIEQFNLPGMLGSIASHCQLVAATATSLDFHIDAGNAALLNDRHIERLGELLGEYFGAALKVSVSIAPTPTETPAAYRQRCLDERLLIAKEALFNDPMVNRLIAEFDGVLDPNSVQLIN